MTHQCQHGQLARVCELCARDAEIAALRAELAQAMKERSRAIAVGDDMEQEVERLRAELADALDCKAGSGPTALSWAIAERDALRAEVAGLREDALRYRWLRPRLFSADFDYNENGTVALVFEMPPNSQIWADCDMTVDAARKGTT